jgi:hypothetical protein
MTDNAPTCRGFKKDGTPCRVTFGLSPDGLCAPHDPARAEQMRAGVAKGVAIRQQMRVTARTILPEGMLRPPKTLDDAVRWSAWAMHAAVTGVIDARTAHEVGFLVNSFTASLQKRDLQREIAELRKQLDQAKQQHTRPRVA